MKSFLFVFDFDQTLLEKNTDVDIQKLAPNGEIPKDIHDIAKSEGWTAFVNACLKYFHEQNISKDQIIEFIRNMPYVNGAIEMIKTLKHEYQADIIIVSDANSVYIEESLKNADILQCFSEIYTNPGEFRENGQLIVTPFTNQTECKLSAINQCKGKIVLDYIKDKDFAFICYAGDGSNDFCPILKLSPADLAFVRQGYALERTISKMKEKENLEVKASIYLWQNAHDIMKIIQNKVQIKNTT